MYYLNLFFFTYFTYSTLTQVVSSSLLIGFLVPDWQHLLIEQSSESGDNLENTRLIAVTEYRLFWWTAAFQSRFKKK